MSTVAQIFATEAGKRLGVAWHVTNVAFMAATADPANHSSPEVKALQGRLADIMVANGSATRAEMNAALGL